MYHNQYIEATRVLYRISLDVFKKSLNKCRSFGALLKCPNEGSMPFLSVYSLLVCHTLVIKL